MPKKLNFLGGQQNYNPNTGEYEPALKGPNGESPSSFKKFKKGDEEKNSFNEYNAKRMGKEEKKSTSFKLDKEKYPDVEETPYGFVYNVNGQSITDLKEQGKKLGEQVDENKQYGFSLTKGGDEVFYETFEDAYNAAKSGHTNKDLKMAKKIDEEMKSVFDDARKKDAETDDRLDKFAEKYGIEFKDIRDEFVNRYQKAIKEQGYGGVDAIDVAIESLEDDLVMGWKPAKEQNSFNKYNQKRTGKNKGLGYDPRNREQSTKNHNDKINQINAKYGRGEMSKEEYWDAIDLEVDRWNSEQEYWYEHEDTPYDKDEANRQEERYHQRIEKRNQEIEPKKLAKQIKSVEDIKNTFGDFLSEKELKALENSKSLYVEISKQYKGGDNYKIIDDEYIKGAFNNGNGSIKDLERYINDNKENAYFVKIR